jgi:hypothetical protein
MKSLRELESTMRDMMASLILIPLQLIGVK